MTQNAKLALINNLVERSQGSKETVYRFTLPELEAYTMLALEYYVKDQKIAPTQPPQFNAWGSK